MIKTIALTANTETEVELTGGCHVSVENRGTSIIYASKSAGVVAGADGVIAIDSGNAKVLRNVAQYKKENSSYDYYGKIYLLSDSDTKAEIQTANDLNFFSRKNSTGGGGYETFKLIKADGISYYSSTKICKFPNNIGFLFLNIIWGSDIEDNYRLKIGEIPESSRPAFNTPFNTTFNNGTSCYIAADADGTIWVTASTVTNVPKSTGVRVVIPYIIV